MRVAIYGGGGQGRVTRDVLLSVGGFEIAGFLDDGKPARPPGAPLLGGRSALGGLRRKHRVAAIVLAVADGRIRQAMAESCRKARFGVVGFIHPRAVVSPRAKLHPGAMIWPNAVINGGAKVGESVVVNTSAVVEHDAELGAFSWVAPGAVVCGETRIGARAYVGAGATVLQCLRVGADAVVGAGSVVLKDLPAGVVAYGVPCAVRRKREG